MTTHKTHPRRAAREAVLQCLYAYEVTKESPEKILQDTLKRQHFEKNNRQFIESLFTQSMEHRDWCEAQISSRLNNWDYNRVALLDRLLLIEAISELFFMEDVPPKVTLSEAIEIAKQYSTEESPGFVNGVLDNVYKTMIKNK